jgi:hypothetical protein
MALGCVGVGYHRPTRDYPLLGLGLDRLDEGGTVRDVPDSAQGVKDALVKLAIHRNGLRGRIGRLPRQPQLADLKLADAVVRAVCVSGAVLGLVQGMG